MSRVKDITGQRFERLLVIRRDGSDKNGQACWLCQCDCGNTVTVSGKLLRSGNNRSCGCIRRERTIEMNTTHGLSMDGEKKSNLFQRWMGMKNRCYNPKNDHYHRYGGRGISVCDEWLNDFQSFYDWSMSNGYKKKLQIDRIDNDGNYCPENCRWVTNKKNARNASFTKINMDIAKQVRALCDGGMIAKDIASLYRISIPTVYDIKHRRTWNDEE